MEKKVIYYTRCSTNTQANSIEMQESEILSFIQRREDYRLIHGFREVGVSGCKQNRPELDKLVEMAKHRSFEILVIWKLDRIGRSINNLISLVNQLKEYGIKIVSIRDNIDFSTPSGEFFFHLLAAMSQYERSILSERTKSALKVVKDSGRTLGRPSFIDKSKVYFLRDKGLTMKSISTILGVSVGGVHKILKARNSEIQLNGRLVNENLDSSE